MAQAQKTRPRSGHAIASLVLGILGIGLIPLIASVVAIGYGISARRQTRDGLIVGYGMATAGLTLGVIGTVWGVWFLIILMKALNNIGGQL